MPARFYFGDIVVVDDGNIGCIVKSWERMTGPQSGTFMYYVYVRNLNSIEEYDEKDIQRYITGKELLDEEKEWHY